MAKELPKQVIDLFNDPQAVKVLATHSAASMHVVPLGSLFAPAPNVLVYGRGVANKETHENLLKARQSGELVSALAVKGPLAYQVRCHAKDYATSGPALEVIRQRLRPLADQMKMNVNDLIVGVWTLEPVAVISQGLGPNAGKPM